MQQRNALQTSWYSAESYLIKKYFHLIKYSKSKLFFFFNSRVKWKMSHDFVYF